MNIQKDIRQIARNVLKEEAEAIMALQDLVNDGFENVVKAILASSGRVVVTGIGKSAIIANKIVATLNSTGTPALFMHAADAIHGDLGMIQANDVVIAISKSGDTPEIKVLVPLLKNLGIKFIAMVSNTSSYLAQNADYILNAHVDKEACPNNLAPTTSTTAALALGDALAVALLECRNFTSADFARYHPGGALGKKLYLRVGDISSINQKPCIPPDASISRVIMEISSKRLGATAVINADGSLAGIVTDGDIRRMLNKYTNLEGITAADIMTVNPATVDSGEYAVKALEIMTAKNITQLIAMNGNTLAGFVHLHDLIKEGIVL